MIKTIPKSEQRKFASILHGQAQRFGLSAEEYLKKVWYHEEASRIGEYIAMTFVEELLSLVPSEETGEQSSDKS